VSLIEALAPPVTFDELFAFYRDSGFLYPGKLAAVDDRRDAVERTWRILLGAGGSVFRFISRRALAEGRPRLVNAICAFAYAPGTWQAQHLVSLQRREYTGTLALLLALSEWGHDIGIEFARFSFRPTNPGTNALFGGIAERLPSDLASLSLVDYGLTNLRDIDLPGGRDFPVAVRSLDPTRARRQRPSTSRFSTRWSWTHFASRNPGSMNSTPPTRSTDSRGAAPYSSRSTATASSAPASSTTAPRESTSRFSRTRSSTCASRQTSLRLTRRATWLSLARTAVAEVARTRDYVVCLTHPGDRDLATAAGLVPAAPKQYAVLTVAMPDGFAGMTDCFTDYYRGLLGAQTTLEEAR
jgi:hypothetical protein